MGRKAARNRINRAVPSEKHDLLYSKARYVLNQRHIKRPWFNLNPFLERTDESEDLENYLPDESKYIQPLESLVLCESFRDELPVDTREIAVGHFFDYLFSDEWSEGCSVRVLEGQLLNQLLVCLYRMEREKALVRHTTYALAKNKRIRSGCYKLADKTAYGFIEETLLIELAYFGRLTKEEPNPVTLNPLEYLRHGVPEFTEDTPPLSFSPSPDGIRRKRATSMSVDSSYFRSFDSRHADTSLPKADRTGRRLSLMAKPINAIRFIQAVSPRPRRMSTADSLTSSGTPLSILHAFSETHEDPIPEVRKTSKHRGSVYKFDGIDPKELLKKFPVHRYHKPVDGDRMEEDKESDYESHEEDEDYFGDEFYLSNETSKGTRGKSESVKTKLQRKKVELQERRKENAARLRSKQKLPVKPTLPPLPPLDMEKIQEQGVLHFTIRMPDELPTFEQFIRILKDDEYYDPRFRNKIKLKSRKIAQRYYMAKGRRNSHLFDANANPCNMLAQQQQLFLSRVRRGSNASDYNSRANIRLPVLVESDRGLARGLRPPNYRIGETDSVHNDDHCANIADEVLGVTDSEACREHCLVNGRSANKANEDRLDRMHDIFPLATRGSGSNIGRTPTGKSKVDKTEYLSVPPRVASPDFKCSKSPLPPIFPKAPLCDEEIEYPETDSEDSESEDDTVPCFDTNKVNIRYSIERLRKKQRKKKKKPVFYDILAKYYKMQNALTAFRKGSMTREIKNAKARARKMSLAGYFRGEQRCFKPIEEMVVGKMKKFDFLETSPKRPMDFDKLGTADFSVPCQQKFFQRLSDAVGEFVVRREIVVSNLSTFNKSATSVTFTKKSCFEQRHTSCAYRP